MLPLALASRALFLDRDGTIIRDTSYPRDPAMVELLPGAAEALREIASFGVRLVVVSNQSGVARGIVSNDALVRVQERVAELLAEHGVALAAFYFCPHGPDDGCSCRKPSPGLIARAARDLDLDLSRSAMIGDKPSDVGAGRAAGCKAVLFGSSESSDADAVARSWDDAIVWLRDFFSR